MTVFLLDLHAPKVYCLVRAYFQQLLWSPFIYKGFGRLSWFLNTSETSTKQCGFTDRNTILMIAKLEESA